MEPEVDSIKLRNSQISKLYNMHSEIEKIERENLGHYGLHVLMQDQGPWMFLIRD